MTESCKALAAALRDSNALIERAQAILADHLKPDGLSEQAAIFRLCEVLDGPEQRRVQAATRAALELDPEPAA